MKRRTLAGESKAALARDFGVTRPTVYRALKGS
ncbi:helix-turn-helix domain-containing protein [Corynebacterium diphtheriae]|nr:helix-turn-helix domain-containing protein [Corynebacterium diphtheriae]